MLAVFIPLDESRAVQGYNGISTQYLMTDCLFMYFVIYELISTFQVSSARLDEGEWRRNEK